MINRYTFILLSLLFAVCSCGITSKNSTTDNDIPFITASNYFVNNTYSGSGVIKITSQKQFNSVFGMATVMGKEGTPTKIDFDTQYVIAIIEKESDKSPQIIVNSLREANKSVVVDYSVKEGSKTSYTIRPLVILILSDKYEGDIVVSKQK